MRMSVLVGTGAQALSSISNFLLMVAIARVATPVEFGGFALAYSLAVIAVAVSRGLIGESLSIAADPPSGSGGRRALGAGLGVGLCVTVLVLLSLIVIPWPAQMINPILAFGVGLPVLFLHEAGRYVAFAKRRPAEAAIADAIWLGAFAVTWAVGTVLERDTAMVLVFGWLVGAALGTTWLVRRFGSPSTRQGLLWLVEERRTSVPFATEHIVQSLASHGTAWVVGSAIGLPAAGALRGAQTLIGPLNALFLGTNAVLLPRLAHERQSLGDRLIAQRAATLSAMLLGVTAIAVLLLANLPDAVGTALLGETWKDARPLLIPVGLGAGAGALMAGIRLGLRALHAVKASLQLRIALGALGFIGGSSLAITAGVQAAAYGIAVGQLIATAGGAVWLAHAATSTSGTDVDA